LRALPVCREREVNCVKKVPVYTEQMRKVCCKETVWETKMVNKTSYKNVQETCMKKQLVRLGHWEERPVQPLFGGGGGGGGFGGLFGGHHGGGCNSGCNDPCATNNNCNNNCNNACPRTKKCWVHCPEYRECPVTVCKKVCVTECVPCKVAVCKMTWKEEKVKVCTYQCVTEKRIVKCTEYETRQVPCKATRTVRVCVPCEQTVNVCRMVRREVAPAAAAPCNNANACNNACNDNCGRGGLFSRLHNRGGCNDACQPQRDCCRPATTSCCR